MVREWTRQAARATGASLLAPLVLLVAAAAVASGGGLGALGQAAGGPALPDIGAPPAAASALADAEIVGAGASEPPAASASPGPVAPPGPPASGPGGAGGGARPGSDIDPVDVSPLPPPGSAPSAPSPGSQSPAPPAPGGGQPPPADVIEETRGIGESLPGPLGPSTGDILDLLLPR